MKKRNKYGAKGIQTEDGYFHSKGEYARWKQLKLMDKASAILELDRQRKFSIDVNNAHICNYIMDFVYYDRDIEQWVAEDFKGYQTDLNKIKVKLFKAIYTDWEFRLVRRSRR